MTTRAGRLNGVRRIGTLRDSAIAQEARVSTDGLEVAAVLRTAAAKVATEIADTISNGHALRPGSLDAAVVTRLRSEADADKRIAAVNRREASEPSADLLTLV